jgi:hypothetical protein
LAQSVTSENGISLYTIKSYFKKKELMIEMSGGNTVTETHRMSRRGKLEQAEDCFLIYLQLLTPPF